MPNTKNSNQLESIAGVLKPLADICNSSSLILKSTKEILGNGRQKITIEQRKKTIDDSNIKSSNNNINDVNPDSNLNEMLIGATLAAIFLKSKL